MDHAALNDCHQDSAYRRIELITGEPRRRQWTDVEKAEMLGESFRPGVCVTEVARRYGVSRSLLCNWRRQAKESRTAAERTFVPIRVVDGTGAERVPAAMEREEGTRGRALAGTAEGGGAAVPAGMIDIEVGRVRVRVIGIVDAAALQQVLVHLGCKA